MTSFTTYYLPIQSTSLAHYFGSGIVLPASWIENKPADIQNDNSNQLLLCKKKWVKNTNCSLEVVICDGEFNLTPAGEDFFFLDGAIPISRIKFIYFLDEEQQANTIWNINKSSAFIPQRLLLIDKAPEAFIDSPELSERPQEAIRADLLEKAKRFNILLGGFAFMKLGALNENNFSLNYFPTLGYFNNLISQQFKDAKQSEYNFNNYTGLFSSRETVWTKWLPYIYNNVSVEEIDKLAQKENIKIEKKFGIIQLESLNKGSTFFDIALLSIYGNHKQKSTEDLLSYLGNNNISENKVEEICLIFGLHNGYSRLRNKYKISNKEIPVKVQLESKLDYYLIESIFQFVFHSKRDNWYFDYLDTFVPSLKYENNSKQDYFIIIDTPVFFSRKGNISLSDESFLSLSDKLIAIVISATPALSHPFNKYSIDIDAANRYYKENIEGKFIHVLKQEFQGIIEEASGSVVRELKDKIARLENELKYVGKTEDLNSKINTSLSVPEPLELDKSSKLGFILNEELSACSFVQLKKIAEALGITVSVKSKGNKKDIENLKEAISQKKLGFDMSQLTDLIASASDAALLDRYILNNFNEIYDFFNWSTDADLQESKDNIEEFVNSKRIVLLDLPKSKRNLSFLALLLDASERLGLISSFKYLSVYLRSCGFNVGSRLIAAALYLIGKRDATALLNVYDQFYDLLQSTPVQLLL